MLGKNGTGKSTLLYLISGLLKPKSGNIEFDGTDTFKRLPETLSDMFLVPDEFDFPDMKIGDFIKVYAPFYTNFSKEKFQNCLTDFGITEVKSLKGISLGQKKKIYISFALATGTRLLMFDEPTSALDPQGRSEVIGIIERLKKLGCTIVLSTHILSDVERVANRIGIVNGSMIAEEGDMSTILRKYGGDVISMSVRNLTQEQKIALLKIDFARAEFNNDTGVFRFGTDNADETSKRLIKLAADNNMVIEDYKIGTATLEEVFRKVVG